MGKAFLLAALAAVLSSCIPTANAQAGSSGGCNPSQSCAASSFTTSGAISGGVITGTSVTLSAGSGSNAVAVSTNGARIDFGAGANDHCSSSGTTITCGGEWDFGTGPIRSSIFAYNGGGPFAGRGSTVANTDGSVHARVYPDQVKSAVLARVFEIGNGAPSGAPNSRTALYVTPHGMLVPLGLADASFPTCNADLPTASATGTCGAMVFGATTKKWFACDCAGTWTAFW